MLVLIGKLHRKSEIRQFGKSKKNVNKLTAVRIVVYLYFQIANFQESAYVYEILNVETGAHYKNGAEPKSQMSRKSKKVKQ